MINLHNQTSFKITKSEIIMMSEIMLKQAFKKIKKENKNNRKQN